MTKLNKWTLFQTSDGWQGLILRVTLGVVMFPHGAQKLFGWFGGHGLSASVAFFADKMHIPAPLTILVILAESAGAAGLVVGFCTRVAAFSREFLPGRRIEVLLAGYQGEVLHHGQA